MDNIVSSTKQTTLLEAVTGISNEDISIEGGNWSGFDNIPSRYICSLNSSNPTLFAGPDSTSDVVDVPNWKPMKFDIRRRKSHSISASRRKLLFFTYPPHPSSIKKEVIELPWISSSEASVHVLTHSVTHFFFLCTHSLNYLV